MPNSECPAETPAAFSEFGIRNSEFFRPSGFGFRPSFGFRISDFGFSISFPPNGAEDQVQLLRFSPQLPSLVLQCFFRGRDHPQEKHRLLRFLPAGANAFLEVLS